MAEHCPLKMKRKGCEDVADDFSDFSLSSPATKMRRLDVELPPIIEEEGELEIPVMAEPQEQSLGRDGSGGMKVEELPENEERALVLFKPFSSTPFVQSPSNFSVDPHLFSGLKSRVLRPWGPANDDEVATEEASSGCQALVPWAPPRYPSSCGVDLASETNSGEDMMDAEELGEATMEVEDSTGGIQHSGGGGVSVNESLHQWRQHHCMIPQPPQNTATPIFWDR